MTDRIGETESDALEALEYPDRWLESGLLDPALLAEQHARLLAGGTRKTGTYRSQAIRHWLEGEEAIADADLESFIEIVGGDADAKVARAGLVELIQSPRLRLEQLQALARSPHKPLRRHADLIRRTALARRIDGGIDDALFEEVLESKDAALQTGLLRDDRLARKHAELLANRGANPTIRERARAWVQDKRAWKSTRP